MSTQGGLNIVTDGLELQIDADNKLGNVFADVNNVVNPTDLGTFVNGLTINNGLLEFDGVDDRLDLGLFFNNHGNQFTFSFWAKHNVLTSAQCLFWKRGTNNSDVGCLFNSPATGYGEFATAPPTTSVRTTSYPTVGVWYNVVCTVDFTTSKSIYYNGALENTNTSVTSFQNVLTEEFVLGARKNNVPSTSFAFNFNGQMSGISVWDRVLTATEIKQNYEALKHNFE